MLAYSTMRLHILMAAWMSWCLVLPLVLRPSDAAAAAAADDEAGCSAASMFAAAVSCAVMAALLGLAAVGSVLKTVDDVAQHEHEQHLYAESQAGKGVRENLEPTSLPSGLAAFKTMVDHFQAIRFVLALRLAWPPVLLQLLHAMVRAHRVTSSAQGCAETRCVQIQAAAFGLAVDIGIDGVLMRTGTTFCYGQAGAFRLLVPHVPILLVLALLCIWTCKKRGAANRIKAEAASERGRAAAENSTTFEVRSHAAACRSDPRSWAISPAHRLLTLRSSSFRCMCLSCVCISFPLSVRLSLAERHGRGQETIVGGGEKCLAWQNGLRGWCQRQLVRDGWCEKLEDLKDRRDATSSCVRTGRRGWRLGACHEHALREHSGAVCGAARL